MKPNYVTRQNQTINGPIPQVSIKYGIAEVLGAMMVRWGINRDSYRVTPGLYAVGIPDNSSDVFVTANYKLSFDTLRKNLLGINGWILVLDTRGINVWCAAGKGTFGTKELVFRINSVSLDKIVSHKRIILPQLGAAGVAAHKVKDGTGFDVNYGPVRAKDITRFVNSGYRTDIEMRKVKFNLWDRTKLIPVELVYNKYYFLGALILLSLLSCIGISEISLNGIWSMINPIIINLLLAYISGVVVTPLLLPYIPGKSFSVKGFTSGFLISIIFLFMKIITGSFFAISAWFLIITALSSFLAMNFTGSSTFTSLSGVKKEMKVAVPLQIGIAATGIVLFVIDKFLK